MNLQTLFAVAAAALVGSVAADEDCTTAQQTTAFTALAGLLTGTDLTSCSDASGYNMLYATALPTDAEMVKMCAADSCHSLIATVISKNPPNCLLTIPTSGAKMNVYTLATTFESDCTALTATPAPATTTATPSATTATPSATTATPSATTATPSATTATPSATTTTPEASSSSSAGSSTVDTPVASSSTGSKAAC